MARRRLRPRLGLTLVLVTFALATAGLIVRLTVRDATAATGMLYYGTPWPVIASLVILAGGGLRWRSRSPWSIPLAATGLLVLAVSTWTNCRSPKNVGLSGTTLSCLVWNCDHGQRGWDRVADAVRAFETDIVCLVEAGSVSPLQTLFWQRAFPDHASGGLGSGMLVLVKNGTVRQVGSGSLDGNARYRQFDVHCHGQSLTIFVIDVKSTPWLWRKSPLQSMHEVIREFLAKTPNRPVLVTGDFNTPSDSVWFSSWRETLQNAWEQAGAGYRPTWPVPLPVHDLDQCWGNDHITFTRCQADWSTWSDHRPVLTRFAVAAQTARAR